jgi:hypothetical protein
MQHVGSNGCLTATERQLAQALCRRTSRSSRKQKRGQREACPRGGRVEKDDVVQTSGQGRTSNEHLECILGIETVDRGVIIVETSVYGLVMLLVIHVPSAPGVPIACIVLAIIVRARV